MLKRALIGLGIGVGALMACSVIILAGALLGGMMGYLGGRYATEQSVPGPVQEVTPPTPAWPEPPEEGWPGPMPGPMLPYDLPDIPWGLLGAAAVTDVVADGPADEAGLEVDDLIIAVDGLALESGDHLSATVRSHAPGDKLALTIIRREDDTQVLQLEVTLGRDRDEQGQVVAYLGIWYRYIGSPSRMVPPAEGSWD
jgi:membrane-associated protease RseP (regulator of RpoE activity)